jgi:hypothetical protein
LILLDVRSHLDRETGDVLGHQQWVWLESEIINDDGAALIVVGSGMQVCGQYHDQKLPEKQNENCNDS